MLGVWLTASAPAAVVFNVTSFASPPWSLTYESGFTGMVGVTMTWPAEMGWQGDQIDIAFNLGSIPPVARNFRFRMVVPYRYTQAFDVEIFAGATPGALSLVHREYIDSGRVIAATIPPSLFTASSTNHIRIKGVGVAVGSGQPAGIGWTRWTLTRTDTDDDPDAAIRDQLQRLTNYTVAAVHPSGLVRDALTYSPLLPPHHPASPDAGGHALVGLCIADELGLITNGEALAESILAAYTGHTSGVAPLRNTKGHWWHWMNVNSGAPEPGWNDNYTTIGSALFVAGALFAKNHFVGNTTIATYADEAFATCDFDGMIDPALNGRVALATNASGGFVGTLAPWNEYMIIVSLALRQPGATRAPAVDHLWLDTANLPKYTYQGNTMLTDSAGSSAPAFWVHQQYFLNTDFRLNASFIEYMRNHQRADALYCAWQLGQLYRYGLTAGVDPTGYFADRIGSHHFVYAPEAVVGWGDMVTMMEFLDDKPANSNPSFRYGLTRVSSQNTAWIPENAALVDHMFLMFGLMEHVRPLFFLQRLPFQTDADGDGIADAFDNCTGFNPEQLAAADANCDGTVNPFDIQAFLDLLGASPSPCSPCAGDTDGNGTTNPFDIQAFLDALTGGGP